MQIRLKLPSQSPQVIDINEGDLASVILDKARELGDCDFSEVRLLCAGKRLDLNQRVADHVKPGILDFEK